MNFPLPFFSLEMNDIQYVFFHKVKDGNFITVYNELQGVFLSAYGA